MPCRASYSTRPCSHKATKTSASVHSWKRRWAELLEQMPVSFSACHWQPVRSTKKMASIAFRSSTRGRWHPKGCGLRGGSKGTMRSHNSSGIRQSRWAFSWSSGISEAPMWKAFLSVGYHQIAYWDSLLGDLSTASERLHYALTHARAVNLVEEELPALTALAELHRRQQHTTPHVISSTRSGPPPSVGRIRSFMPMLSTSWHNLNVTRAAARPPLPPPPRRTGRPGATDRPTPTISA